MPGRWLHSARFDLVWFVGPAILSLLLVIPVLTGHWPHLETPVLGWVILVLGVDVAHVWASLYRVYLDPVERRRRPWLYGLLPVGVYATAVLFYAVNPAWFWTILAYVAVHHFVKQQVGFVALYRHRAGEAGRLRLLDNVAVDVGTLVPVAWWHTNLPRRFDWFVPGDFLGPWPDVMAFLWPLYIAVAVIWVAQRLHQWRTDRLWNPGKDLTMVSTWTMWGVGIVVTDSDFAFTATNVLLHGVPYMALVYLVTVRRVASDPDTASGLSRFVAPFAFVGALLGLAFLEEAGWDILVWQDHPMVFGDWGVQLTDNKGLLFVPLLIVPQATHYVLDGFIWRMGDANPGLRRHLLGS